MVSKSEYTLESFDIGHDAPFVRSNVASSASSESYCVLGDPESMNFSADTLTEYTSKPEEIKLWSVRKSSQTIAVLWIDLNDNDVSAPSLHMICGDDETQLNIAKEAIRYAYCNLPYANLNSRHIVGKRDWNSRDKKLGFEKDGDLYDDELGQRWQNVTLVL